MAKNNTTRVKDKAYVSPDELISYLMSKGVSQNHALGIVSNVKYESNFNPKAIGDNGTSAGLFQHHAGRKDRLMKYIGNDLSNWKKQVDFMLTEDVTQKYLMQDFKTPEKASYWFTTQWERPKDKEQKGVERQAWIASYKGGKYSNGIYNPSGGETFYTYPGRPEARYKKDEEGNWLVLTPNTGGVFVKIDDPTGSRTEELNKKAIEYYSAPPEDYNTMSPYEAEGLTEAEIEAMGINQDEMMQEADIAAAVQKEMEKIKEKERKEQESIARKKLEQLKVEKKKAMVESAFNSAIDAINAINQKPKRNSQIANIGSYQGVDIPIQSGLPSLPSLSSFEIGGMVGDDEDPPENKKQREQRLANELLYQLQGYYTHIDPQTGQVATPDVISFGEDYTYKKPDKYIGTPSYTNRTVIDKDDPSKTKYDYLIAGKVYNPDISTAVDTGISFSDDDKVIITFHEGTMAPVPVGTGPKSDKYLKEYFYQSPDKTGRGFAEFYTDKKLLGKDQIIPYFRATQGEYGESYGSFQQGMLQQQEDGGEFYEGNGGDDFSTLNNGNTRVKTRTKRNGDKVTVIFENLGDGSFKRTKLITRDGEIIKKRELYGEGSVEDHFDPAGEMGENFREEEEEHFEEEIEEAEKKKPGKPSTSKYKKVFEYEKGGTVSSLWEERTGLPWSQAKALGLTDGSYDANIALREKLKAGELDIKGGKKPMKQVNDEISKAETFSEAFRVAREQLGSNKMFKWNGRVYGTNLAGEKFEPSEEELSKFNMNDDYTKNRLKKENKEVESPYTSKEVVKVEPEWKDWEDIKKAQKEQNKMSNAEKIVSTYKGKNEKYLIVDKKNSRMHLYQGDRLIDTYEVGTGMSEGDEQTKTVIKDGKVLWDQGNKQTGAGVFTVSGVSEYRNAPSFILKNERGEEVPTVIHATLPEREQFFGNDNLEDNRMSYGCINGLCSDMNELYSHGIDEGVKVYVLPEDEGNSFKIENGKLNFRSSDPNVNRTQETLNYIPIIPEVDFGKIKINSNDENAFKSIKNQKDRVEQYAKALADKKRDIMKLTKINGDVYNEIAKMSFGILGTESDYAAKYGEIENLSKGVARKFSSSVGGPDYQFEYDYREGDGIENYSIGMTQIAWKNLDNEEKKLLENLGVYRPKDLTKPDKAAIATTALLAHRFNNRSFDVEGKKTRINEDNMWELLPKVWNNAENYAERVKANATPFSIKQLNDPEKLKQVKDGYKQAEAFAKKYVKETGITPSESMSVSNQKDIDKIKAKKKLQAFVDEKPKDSWLGDDPFYEERRKAYINAYGLEDNRTKRPQDMVGETAISARLKQQPISGSRKYEEGGEYELTEEEIQELRDGGYKIEYLD